MVPVAMELGLLLIIIFTNALQATYSTINGAYFINDTKVTGSIAHMNRGIIQKITNLNIREDERSASNDVVKSNPASIRVRQDSILYSDAGQEILINFEITNNQYKPILYIFEVYIEDNLLENEIFIKPKSSDVLPYSTALVKVQLIPRNTVRETNKGLLTFKAKWASIFEEEVTQQVYYYVGTQKPDSSGPTISYTFNGDCSGYLHPKQCHDKIWKADILIQDADSGLLSINSDPIGLTLNKKFVVGTKEEVSGNYRANCCQSKVDITAIDTSGNENTIGIDIEKKWLLTGEIISIVLGAILLVLLIIAIIACIVCLCRRKRRTLNIYPDTIRS